MPEVVWRPTGEKQRGEVWEEEKTRNNGLAARLMMSVDIIIYNIYIRL